MLSQTEGVDCICGRTGEARESSSKGRADMGFMTQIWDNYLLSVHTCETTQNSSCKFDSLSFYENLPNLKKMSWSYVTLCLVVFFFLVKAGEVRVKNFSNLRSHCFCIQNFFCFPDLLLRSFLDLLHGHDKRFSKASSTLQKFIFCLQIQRQNFEANWEDDIWCWYLRREVT